MARFESLTILCPMWNEEAYVRQVVEAGREVCEELIADGEIGDYELLIVDDASTDATGAIADELAVADWHVRVIHHPENRRLGGSLKTGFSRARGELILYTDADLPFDLAETKKACRLLRIYRADVVSAYRHDRTSEGPRRAFYSFVYNWMIRLVFGIHIRDVNFSFKLCRRRIFGYVRLASEGSFIDAELLVRAQRLGFRIVQFGVDYFPRHRGLSTLSSGSVIVGVLREMLALQRELRKVPPLPSSELALACAPDAPAADTPTPPMERRAAPAARARVNGGDGVVSAEPRLLIVNADDYGLTEAISRGILRAHREGIVTSTSVLAVGPAFEKAARWLADAPELGVGVHLAAVGEDPPLLPPREIPTLVDRRGAFAPSWRSFVAQAVAGWIDREDLARELAAQVERVAALGMPITHLDTHQHLHLWPPVRETVLELARRHGIPAVRVPRSHDWRLVGAGVNRLSRSLARRAEESGLAHPADFAGLDEAGRLDAGSLERVLDRLAARRAPTAELCTHPGEADDPERHRYRWGYHWAEELAALSAPGARRALAGRGFVPATFAELGERRGVG